MARNLTRDGVEGLRWVLLEPLETAPAAGAPAGQGAGNAAPREAGVAPGTPVAAPLRVAPAPRPEPDRRTTPRQTLMLGLLKTLVLLLALGAAVATAWRVIGPPRLPGDGVRPAARPASPMRPAASARTVTASLVLPAARQADQEVSR